MSGFACDSASGSRGSSVSSSFRTASSRGWSAWKPSMPNATNTRTSSYSFDESRVSWQEGRDGDGDGTVSRVGESKFGTSRGSNWRDCVLRPRVGPETKPHVPRAWTWRDACRVARTSPRASTRSGRSRRRPPSWGTPDNAKLSDGFHNFVDRTSSRRRILFPDFVRRASDVGAPPGHPVEFSLAPGRSSPPHLQSNIRYEFQQFLQLLTWREVCRRRFPRKKLLRKARKARSRERVSSGTHVRIHSKRLVLFANSPWSTTTSSRSTTTRNTRRNRYLC